MFIIQMALDSSMMPRLSFYVFPNNMIFESVRTLEHQSAIFALEAFLHLFSIGPGFHFILLAGDLWGTGSLGGLVVVHVPHVVVKARSTGESI